MKNYLCVVLFLLAFFSYAQLRINDNESFYSMKGTFNSDKKESVKKVIEEDFGQSTKEGSDFIWNGAGSFEILLKENKIIMEVQKSNDNQEIVMKIKNLGDKIMAIKNINNQNLKKEL